MRSAFASIWRIRSRVTRNDSPTSSSVRSRPSKRPKRMQMTVRSRSVSVESAFLISSLNAFMSVLDSGAASSLTARKSPTVLSPSSPTGASRDTVSEISRESERTRSVSQPMLAASSSTVGSRPSSSVSRWSAERYRFSVSCICTGSRIVRL